MSLSRNIKAVGSAAVSALAVFLMAAPAHTLAQGSVEDLYQRATQALSKMDVEGACDQFQQIERQSPGYKDVQSSLRAACAATAKLHEAEETLYTECSQLYNQKQFEDAKVKCANALDKSNKLRHPKFREQAAQILRSIDAKKAEGEQASQKQQQCAKIFQDASALANQGRAEEARDRFSQVVQMGCSRASDAQARIDRIDAQLRSKVTESDREKRADEALNDCTRRYNSHDLRGAQGRCEEVVRLNGKKRAAAETILAKINQELASNTGGTPAGPAGGKTPPPGGTEVTGNEDLLKAGLRAYFKGDYSEADRSLSHYLDNHGAKSALAYFFRGAAHSSRYFLSGEKESEQKSHALADFRDANTQGLTSKPSEKFVSPKILALYQEAVSTGGR